MSLTGVVKPSQLRHALRTPLNQIAGYTEMLIEDLSCLEDDPVRQALDGIRENGRIILDLLQEELPPGEAEITSAQLDRVRTRIEGPLQAVIRQVGRLISGETHPADGTRPAKGFNVADVLRIGAAAAELVEFTTGVRDVLAVAEPVSDGLVLTGALASGDVLVIDDNPGNRDLLSRMLERHGLRAWPAADGEIALTQLGRQRFDLILLDLMMPGMDGITLLERLKADKHLRNIPVIMLSALDETSRVIQCLEMGAEDYVVKPFDPVLLLARLRSTLERSRLRVAETMRARELENAYEKLRENEQRLQESEERLRLATEAAEVGIWYFYAQQDRVVMTPGCKRLFGFAEDDEPLTFREMQEHIHPDDRERTDAETRAALKNQSEYDAEFKVLWPDGAVHWVSLRGLAQCHGPEREMRLAGVALDITSRKQAEESALQAHKLESIGLLAGGIAHDFNNLLTGIIGSASFVMDNLSDDDPNAEMLGNVITAGERAADLTRQLLAYSGKGKFSVQRLDLSKLVNEISVLLRTSISRAVTLERHLDEQLPAIEADASQIQQIVMNLVINGSEAITGEGQVNITTGVAHLGTFGREAFLLGEDVPEGDYVYLEVKDTGSGMEKNVLRKIFEPFFTTKFTGRGLGLAAVFGIVRGHDGALEVVTAPGEGSRFRVYFPPVTGPAPRRPSKNAPVKCRVLFVDDEPVVRLMGKTALERAGYEVLMAKTGEEALRILEEQGDGFAAAILDLSMPGWSGFETLHRIKQSRPGLRVLISSGHDQSTIRAKFPGEDPGSLLEKPYSAAALVARVRQLLA